MKNELPLPRPDAIPVRDQPEARGRSTHVPRRASAASRAEVPSSLSALAIALAADRSVTRRASYCTSCSQRPRVADRADLGDVAAEGQADGPIDHRADLAEQARDLAQVVGPGHPPGEEAREGTAADPAHRLVAAEVDERRACSSSGSAEGPRPRSAAATLLGDRPWPAGSRAGRSAGASAARLGDGGAVAHGPDAVHGPRRGGGRRRAPGRCSSSGTERLRKARMRDDAGGPDHGPGRVRSRRSRAWRWSPSTSSSVVPSRISIPRPRSWRHGVVGQLGVDLGQHPVGRPRPGSSASRAGGRADSGPSRRRRSPGARRAPRARRSRRRRRRR